MGKVALYWPSKYLIDLKAIPHIIVKQGTERILELELWHEKGASSGNPLMNLELTAESLGNDMPGGDEVISNGYFQIREHGVGAAWTTLDGSQTYYIGNRNINSMLAIDMRINIPNGALSKGKVGWWLSEVGVSGDVQNDLDGEWSWVYNSSGVLVEDAGAKAIPYGAGTYGGPLVQSNRKDRNQFQVLLIAFVMDQTDVARREAGGWVIN